MVFLKSKINIKMEKKMNRRKIIENYYVMYLYHHFDLDEQSWSKMFDLGVSHLLRVYVRKYLCVFTFVKQVTWEVNVLINFLCVCFFSGLFFFTVHEIRCTRLEVNGIERGILISLSTFRLNLRRITYVCNIHNS